MGSNLNNFHVTLIRVNICPAWKWLLNSSALETGIKLQNFINYKAINYVLYNFKFNMFTRSCFVHLSILLANTIFLISVRSQHNITDMGTGFDLCVCCEWSTLMMVVKKGLQINLAIKQDSANISNYGVKTIPLDSNVLLISHPSKVTYYTRLYFLCTFLVLKKG